MDVTSIVLLSLAIFLAGGLWVWWKDGRSLQPFLERLRRRLRQGLGAANMEDVRHMREHLQEREHEMEARLTTLETATKFSAQHLLLSKDIDRRLVQLESSDLPHEPSEKRSAPRPRSIVRYGLRFTLNDGIWEHLGSTTVADVDQTFVGVMVQGPFCVACLKRLMSRDQVHLSHEVPAQCRHCGRTWSCENTLDSPLSLIDLKQRIFEDLNQEYHTLGKIQPYNY